MLEYVHFVPGRLRLKMSELRNQCSAAEAEAVAAAIPAVKSAVANPLTGSLTISFENGKFVIEDLWNRLCAKGYASGPCPEAAMTETISIHNLRGDRVGQAVLTGLLEALLQHSAQVLLRSLL